jgi:hypothetical protein
MARCLFVTVFFTTMLGLGSDGKHQRSDYPATVVRPSPILKEAYLSLENLPLRKLSHILILKSWPSLNPAGQADLP